MQYNSIMYSATAGHSFARWPVRARAPGLAAEHALSNPALIIQEKSDGAALMYYNI